VYYSDAFGTPTFKDASGTTLAGTSTGTRFLSTGREWLEALNLYDYRNRTYSAELGRFSETDPIRFNAGDVNLYRYVDNSVVNFRDNFGLTKGGKQDIRCEGFDKNSDPKRVEEAIRDAQKNGQKKRERALRGILKVIKRGGAFLNYYLMLLEQACTPCEGA
jgi:RHS repeat-associated protein